MSESVGVGAGFDDGAVEGESIDDGGAEARIGEGFCPARKGFVSRDGDRVLFLSFGEDLEQELSAAPVEFHIAELIDAEQVHPPISGDGFGEHFFVRGFDEFIHEPSSERIFHPVSLLRRGGTEADEQVRFAGSRISDRTQGLTLADPLPGRQGVDGCGVDVGVCGLIPIQGLVGV